MKNPQKGRSTCGRTELQSQARLGITAVLVGIRLSGHIMPSTLSLEAGGPHLNPIEQRLAEHAPDEGKVV